MNITGVPEPLEHIRRHSSMYIPDDDRPLRDRLLIQLVTDAVALGVKDLVLEVSDDWAVVASNTDWLRLGRFQKTEPRDLFRSVVPLVEAGQNSIRHEVVVNALASAVVVSGPEGTETISGAHLLNEEELQMSQRCRAMGKVRVVAFMAT